MPRLRGVRVWARAMSARLLVVEDQVDVRHAVCNYLRLRGYSVTEASTGGAFVAALRDDGFELVLLDLNLPDADGLQLLREARIESNAPIFVVSGRCTEADRIRALEYGADDFVVKPFSIRELELRIRNFLLRQTLRTRQEDDAEVWTFADWRVDLPRRVVVSLTGEPVALTRGEFELLCCLVRAEGAVVSRRAILEALHDTGVLMGDESLTTLVYRLRRKLGRDDAGGALIETAPAVGFRIAVPVYRGAITGD